MWFTTFQKCGVTTPCWIGVKKKIIPKQIKKIKGEETLKITTFIT